MTQPRIQSVDALPGMRLSVTWDTGRTTEVDLSDLRDDPAFAALSDPQLFAAVTVTDWGCTLEWPDGSDLSFRNIWQRASRAAA